MKMFLDTSEIYLHRDLVDFRKSINGLMTIVEQNMSLSPFTGALFVFCNKSRNKLKLLYWDKTGFALWYKRLEKERFKWPVLLPNATIELDENQLHQLLTGYDVIGHKTLNYQCSGL